jgi:hypothetical protein
MAVRALDNTAFGFPAACFVCDQANPNGLRLSFVHDTEADVVRSDFTAGRFAVSRTSRASFRRPVMVDAPHRVEAVVESHDEASVTARARVFNAENKRCAEASARLVVLSEETARTAIGSDLGDNAGYLRTGRGV